MRAPENGIRLALLVIGGLLLVYCLGYVLCRKGSVIVHTTACAGHEYSSHDVVEGDAKIVSLNPALAAFYTPLRYLEISYWYLTKPLGSSCP